ncbi:MAG: ergothioneine biosynthesis protein EgtB [Bacteroidia bacterium]|nr:ergothioneine biosynthesis protein EgtB [Bacteroidia bacterium]
MKNLLETYHATRKKSVDICLPLNTEDYVPQPVYFASPAKWQLAHITWFFEEMILKPHVKNYKEFHPDFSFLFNSYYQTIGERTVRADRGNITRPKVEEVYAYRRYVDDHMTSLLASEPNNEIRNLVILGIQHEQQHQELMYTDLKYLLGHNPLFPVYEANTDLTNGRNRHTGWLEMDEGVYPIGYTSDGFCFDNELGPHKVYLQPYHISKSLVTNGEYLEFIQSDGYKTFNYWLDEAWTWVNEHTVNHPLYWHLIDGKWYQYTLAGLKPLDMDAPVCHVSFYEANAYANWKGLRLPTEFEWEAAANQLDWGQRWEWTNSAYLPYPGFKIADGAVGEYNGKFMVNQMVLRGASGATSDNHSRTTYRNFFHPHFQWQFSGIRLAK